MEEAVEEARAEEPELDEDGTAVSCAETMNVYKRLARGTANETS